MEEYPERPIIRSRRRQGNCIPFCISMSITMALLLAVTVKNQFISIFYDRQSRSQDENSTGASFELLVSPLVNKWRRNDTINASSLPRKPKLNETCNCATRANDKHCCYRLVARSHKMGHEWSLDIEKSLRPILVDNDVAPFRLTTTAATVASVRKWSASIGDFRIILILRNIYEAFASGYLYHQSGRECWLDSFGAPFKANRKYPTNDNKWRPYVSFPLANSDRITSLCEVLKEQPVEIGMRAYIEFVMKRNYKSHGIFEHLMLVNHVSWIQDRTKIVCFENVTLEPVETVMQQWVDFYYPSSVGAIVIPSPPPESSPAKQQVATQQDTAVNYAGGHATSHDALLRQQLRDVFDMLDGQYFGGQIAWLHSVIPCGSNK